MEFTCAVHRWGRLKKQGLDFNQIKGSPVREVTAQLCFIEDKQTPIAAKVGGDFETIRGSIYLNRDRAVLTMLVVTLAKPKAF